MTEPTRADVFRWSGQYWYQVGTHTHGYEVAACDSCGQLALMVHRYGKSARRGQFCSRSCINSDRMGASNNHWRGDNAGYHGQHSRVYQERGKADQCVWSCEADQYEWANLTGNYLDIWDFAPMCKRCHKRYDGARAMMDRDSICDQWGHPWRPGQPKSRHLGQHMPGSQTSLTVPETRSQARAAGRTGQEGTSASRFRGVQRNGRSTKWKAVCADQYLGMFTDEEDAARAYDAAALARWGRFARLNFPK